MKDKVPKSRKKGEWYANRGGRFEKPGHDKALDYHTDKLCELVFESKK